MRLCCRKTLVSMARTIEDLASDCDTDDPIGKAQHELLESIAQGTRLISCQPEDFTWLERIQARIMLWLAPKD